MGTASSTESALSSPMRGVGMASVAGSYGVRPPAQPDVEMHGVRSLDDVMTSARDSASKVRGGKMCVGDVQDSLLPA